MGTLSMAALSSAPEQAPDQAPVDAEEVWQALRSDVMTYSPAVQEMVLEAFDIVLAVASLGQDCLLSLTSVCYNFRNMCEGVRTVLGVRYSIAAMIAQAAQHVDRAGSWAGFGVFGSGDGQRLMFTV